MQGIPGLDFSGGGSSGQSAQMTFNPSSGGSNALNLPAAMASGGLTINSVGNGGGSVLGANTTGGGSSGGGSGGGGAKQNGGWYNGQQYWAPGQGPSTQSSAPSAPSLPNLDQLYAPILASYDTLANNVNQYKTQDVNDLTSSYNQNKALIPGYQQSAQTQINANQQALQNQLQSAYDQAARNYQWANSGALNQYGYNGAYLGANSMAQQEMQRELGQTGQEGVQGQMQINQQNTDLSNWVNQQNTTLDQQFSSAKDNLNQYFQQQLLAITNDRNATEAQKAQGKVQLLEDVMNQNNAIAMQAQNFKQQLALYNAQLSATGGQNYDLSGFLSQMGVMGNQVNANVNPANQSYGVLTGNNPNQAPTWTTASQGQNNDYLSQLLGGTGTTANLPTTLPQVGTQPGQ